MSGRWRPLRRCPPLLLACAAALVLWRAPSAWPAVHPESAEFLYELALQHLKAGQRDEAIHELRKVLLLAPGHAKALERLELLERGTDAAPAPRPHEAKAPSDFDRALTRGIEAFRRGNLAAASKAFQDAYLIRPSDPELQSWLALIKDEQKRRTEMHRAVERLQQPPKGEPPSARAPFWKRLAAPFWVPGIPEPAELGKGRPEILAEGKRAGFQRLYKEGIGYQVLPGFGLSARTEIYEEPNPIEDYVLETKMLNFTTLADLRRSIVPLYTRSWAVRFVGDREPLPRLTYEFDNRDVFHEFETRFGFKNRNLETHAVNALYSLPSHPWFGTLTLNPWYKRVIQESDQDAGTFEHRDEMILNFSLQSTPDLEYFFQFDTYDADKTRTLGASKLKLYKGQVRMRFPKLRLFVIPSYEYSDTDYDPSDDEFSKRDLFVDWGFDVTNRLRASSKEQVVQAETSRAGNDPSNPDAEVFNAFNTLSYELFPDLDVSVGLDYGKAFGMNAFDNVGLRLETELFKPGLIRSKVGCEWLSYYEISDDLFLVYWKFFLFQ